MTKYNPPIINRLTASVVLLLLTSSVSVFAQDSTDAPTEQDIKAQADKIGKEIHSMLSEAQSNGLNPSDVTMFSSAAQKLKGLSDQEMAQVVSDLNAAKNAKDPTLSTKALLKAYQEQQDIILKLKTLAQDIEIKESQKAVRSRVESLIVRETGVMRKTGVLNATGHPVSGFSPAEEVQHSLLVTEQSSIASDLDLLCKAQVESSDQPAAGAAGAPADSNKPIVDAASQQSLSQAGQDAIQLTTAGPLTTAIAKQKEVRDKLAALLTKSFEGMVAEDRLSELKGEVEQLISDEKTLQDDAKGSDVPTVTVADRQNGLGDVDELAQLIVAPICAPASDSLHTADGQMGVCTQNLMKASAASNVTDFDGILTSLNQADDLLDKRLAAIEAQENASPLDKYAQLQQLKAQVDQAQANPQAAAANLQKMQDAAQGLSPAAAQAIAQAQDQLQVPTPDPAAAAQQLAQASAALQQQLAATQAAAQAQNALAQETQQLNQVQATAATDDQNLANNANMTQSVMNMMNAQQQLSNMAQSPTTPPAAQQALSQAAQDMQNASNQAAAGQAAAAQVQNQQAMQAMQQAQNAMSQAMAQASQPGQGQGQGQSQSQGQGPGQPQAPGQVAQGGGAGAAPQDGAQAMGGSGGDGVGQTLGAIQPKDRQAIDQMQKEAFPQQYSSQVQQYYKNLADPDQQN